ncbi:MAG: helix-turn-helix transcriptional regulator [Rhodovibrionaceae bacterium]
MAKRKDGGSGDVKIEQGEGNVFGDLGRPDAEAQLLKAERVTRIDQILRRRKLTQTQAAKLLGLSQPDVSRLLRGNFREYSLERLLRLLTALGRDVDIVISKPRSRRPGKLNVEAT